jgi:hypothetical protein
MKIVLAVIAVAVASAAKFGSINRNLLQGTPDGQTPANEAVCDLLQLEGVSKGLYGLCVAFCEAQDCEVPDPTDDPSCRPSSPKLLARYDAKRDESNILDLRMPCVQYEEACPCWTLAELTASDDAALTKDYLATEDPENSITWFARALYTLPESVEVLYNANYNRRGPSCRVRTATPEQPTIVVFLDITVDQALACYAQLESLDTP